MGSSIALCSVRDNVGNLGVFCGAAGSQDRVLNPPRQRWLQPLSSLAVARGFTMGVGASDPGTAQ